MQISLTIKPLLTDKLKWAQKWM